MKTNDRKTTTRFQEFDLETFAIKQQIESEVQTTAEIIATFKSRIIANINELQNHPNDLLDYVGYLYINYLKRILAENKDQKIKKLQDLVNSDQNFEQLIDYIFSDKTELDIFLTASLDMFYVGEIFSDTLLVDINKGNLGAICPIFDEEFTRVKTIYLNYSLEQWQDELLNFHYNDKAEDIFRSELLETWVNDRHSQKLTELVDVLDTILNVEDMYPKFPSNSLKEKNGMLRLKDKDFDLKPFRILSEPLFNYLKVAGYVEEESYQEWFNNIMLDYHQIDCLVTYLADIISIYYEEEMTEDPTIEYGSEDTPDPEPFEMVEADEEITEDNELRKIIFEYIFQSGGFDDRIEEHEDNIYTNYTNIFDLIRYFDEEYFKELFIEIILTVYLDSKITLSLTKSKNQKKRMKFDLEFTRLTETAADIRNIIKMLLDQDNTDDGLLTYVKVLDSFFGIVTDKKSAKRIKKYPNVLKKYEVQKVMTKFERYKNTK